MTEQVTHFKYFLHRQRWAHRERPGNQVSEVTGRKPRRKIHTFRCSRRSCVAPPTSSSPVGSSFRCKFPIIPAGWGESVLPRQVLGAGCQETQGVSRKIRGQHITESKLEVWSRSALRSNKSSINGPRRLSRQTKWHQNYPRDSGGPDLPSPQGCLFSTSCVASLVCCEQREVWERLESLESNTGLEALNLLMLHF